jgi:hypothetical protein
VRGVTAPQLHHKHAVQTRSDPEAGFDIVLGRNPPVITPVSGLDNGAAKKIPFPFVVSSTDIQQFQVEAVDSLSRSGTTSFILDCPG